MRFCKKTAIFTFKPQCSNFQFYSLECLTYVFFSLAQPGPEILDIFLDIFGQKYKNALMIVAINMQICYIAKYAFLAAVGKAMMSS